jgi:flagellar protein FliO/FliZ
MSVALFALQTGAAPAPVDPGFDAVRTVVALVVVMVVLGGVLWLLKRGTMPGLGRAGRQALAIESAISLGERRSLVIVTVEGRRLLLGASPMQVSLITELARTPDRFEASLARAVGPGERERA